MTIIEEIEKKSETFTENLKVYIAAPFFKHREISLVKSIEKILDDTPGVSYFSPLKNSQKLSDIITPEMDFNEREDILNKIEFNKLVQIMECPLMIAVIDDKDISTMIEIGIAKSLGKMIITHTSKNFGSNLMISQYALCHTKTLEGLRLAIKHVNYIYNETPILERIGKEVQIFPVADNLKNTLRLTLKDQEFGIHFNPKLPPENK